MADFGQTTPIPEEPDAEAENLLIELHEKHLRETVMSGGKPREKPTMPVIIDWRFKELHHQFDDVFAADSYATTDLISFLPSRYLTTYESNRFVEFVLEERQKPATDHSLLLSENIFFLLVSFAQHFF